MAVYIYLNRIYAQRAPGWGGRSLRNEPGQKISIMQVGYPGEKLPHSIKDDWDFWSSSDIDCAAIYPIDVVDHVEVTADDEKHIAILRTMPPEVPMLVIDAEPKPPVYEARPDPGKRYVVTERHTGRRVLVTVKRCQFTIAYCHVEFRYPEFGGWPETGSIDVHTAHYDFEEAPQTDDSQ